MASVYDIKPERLINEISEELKEEIEAPDWSKWVKTGVSKQRAPEEEDWWYIRAAAVLRKVYVKGPIGVSRLRREYGKAETKKNTPHEFKKGSGKVIRKILQQLEEVDMIEKEEGKGRKITEKGQSLLDKTSSKLEG